MAAAMTTVTMVRRPALLRLCVTRGSRRLATRTEDTRPRVVITGGCGNLGIKVAEHLLAAGTHRIVLYDVQEGHVPEGASFVQADLTQWDRPWQEDLLAGADSVIHFAADTPYPEATWDQAANSGSITSNVFLAACLGRVRRVVFASSNHLMGGHRTRGGPYLDPDDPASPIRPDTEVLVGAKWLAGSIPMDSTPYASAKLFGERLAGTLARAYPATSFVSLRIGWCQPGENTPATLSASGSPITEVTDGGNEGGAQATADPGNDPILTRDWWRLMWLSNRDFLQIITKSLDAALPKDCGGHVVLNANSDNTRMRWDISETRRVLGYQPQDNVADHPIP